MNTANPIARFQSQLLEALKPCISRFFTEIGNGINQGSEFQAYFKRAILAGFELEYDRYSIENPQVARVVPDISSSVVSKTCDDIPRNAKSNDESTALQLNVDFNSMDCPTKVCFKHRGNETREETNDEMEVAPSTSSSPILPSANQLQGEQVMKTNAIKRKNSTCEKIHFTKKKKQNEDPDVQLADDSNARFKCPIEMCGFETNHFPGFKTHQTRLQHYMCGFCKRLFAEKDELVKHLYLHNPFKTESELIDKNIKDYMTLN